MLKVKEINGETWYFDGKRRISEEEYNALYSDKMMEVKPTITRNFTIALDGVITEVTDENVNN